MRAEDSNMENEMQNISDFMTTAASNGMFEVQASQLAMERSNNAQIDEYAQMMVNDHQKANDQLKQLAQQKNVMLPDSLGENMMGHMQDLRDAQANELDMTYLNKMEETHQSAVDLFESAANDIQDPEVQNFASTTLPTLQQHLDRVKQLKETMNNNQ